MQAWRQRRGLTLGQLGQRASVSPNTIARIERGEVNPNLNTLEKIARGLGIKGSALWQGDKALDKKYLCGTRIQLSKRKAESKNESGRRKVRAARAMAGRKNAQQTQKTNGTRKATFDGMMPLTSWSADCTDGRRL